MRKYIKFYYVFENADKFTSENNLNHYLQKQKMINKYL
jgi:hypothetical protein